MNDITVDATWKLLVSDFNDISGKTFGLIGTGNIGSKLVGVLTESGVKLRCFNRDINKEKLCYHRPNSFYLGILIVEQQSICNFFNYYINYFWYANGYIYKISSRRIKCIYNWFFTIFLWFFNHYPLHSKNKI